MIGGFLKPIWTKTIGAVFAAIGTFLMLAVVVYTVNHGGAQGQAAVHALGTNAGNLASAVFAGLRDFVPQIIGGIIGLIQDIISAVEKAINPS